MSQPKAFAVVEFPEENSCATIPSKWLTSDSTCIWPNVKANQLPSLVKALTDISRFSNTYEVSVRVLGYGGK